MKVELKEPVFDGLAKVSEITGIEAYVVGGYVRDLFLGRISKDIDIVVLGDGIEFARMFATSIQPRPDLAFFKNFGTAMVKTPQWEIEFVGARKESYRSQSRKPEVSPGSLQDDQNRRDFTINTLAISISAKNYAELIDPFGGAEDITNKTIRTPLEPGITFSDDPLRMMRAIRFASQLHFEIEPTTFEAIRQHRERIAIISAERINEELNKILLSPKPSVGFNLLFSSGLLQLIFPELYALHGIEKRGGKAHKDNFKHTLQVLDNVCRETGDLWLRWATLLHDIGKAPTKRFSESERGWTFHGHEEKGSRMVKRIFNRFKLPLNEKMKFVEKMVGMHHRPKTLAEEGVTDSAIRRLIVDAGEDLDALFTLCRADMTSRFPEKIQLYRNNLQKVRDMVTEVEERDTLRNWQPPITGEHIMKAFGIGPGREVGIIKTEIREAILDGHIKNNFDEAWQLMLACGHRLGLNAV